MLESVRECQCLTISNCWPVVRASLQVQTEERLKNRLKRDVAETARHHKGETWTWRNTQMSHHAADSLQWRSPILYLDTVPLILCQQFIFLISYFLLSVDVFYAESGSRHCWRIHKYFTSKWYLSNVAFAFASRWKSPGCWTKPVLKLKKKKSSGLMISKYKNKVINLETPHSVRVKLRISKKTPKQICREKI